MNNILRSLAIAMALSCLSGLAQDKAAADLDDLQIALNMLRSDKNSYKIPIINGVMKLTADEAETFWPIYQEYEKDLDKINQRRVVLIKEFVRHHGNGTLVNKNAQDIAKKSLAIVQDRLDLWKKYHRKISRALNPIRGAQFLQIEHQISLLIDINVASEVPVVETLPKN